ncbi:hypothetical protein FTX61_12915 [Nitriliruptoraceae bacterium ZYF776]|nr:hypothetical protein [Profundirhabdus halotolerans]
MEALGPEGPVPARGPMIAAIPTGALAVAALPLTLAFPGQLWPFFLPVGAPVAAALVGRARGVRWLEQAALVLIVVMALALGLGLGAVVVVCLTLAPLVVVALVGPALRQLDAIASASFLVSCAIAIIAGFAAAQISPPGTALLVAVLLVGGCANAVSRLVRQGR